MLYYRAVTPQAWVVFSLGLRGYETYCWTPHDQEQPGHDSHFLFGRRLSLVPRVFPVSKRSRSEIPRRLLEPTLGSGGWWRGCNREIGPRSQSELQRDIPARRAEHWYYRGPRRNMPSRRGSCHDEWYAARPGVPRWWWYRQPETASRYLSRGINNRSRQPATIYVTNRRGSQAARVAGEVIVCCLCPRFPLKAAPAKLYYPTELSYWAIGLVQMTAPRHNKVTSSWQVKAQVEMQISLSSNSIRGTGISVIREAIIGLSL